MMRNFRHIADLIRRRRMSHPERYSQLELSALLGYKGGQFISNVERGICGVPLKILAKVSRILDIPSDELKGAILKDHEEIIDSHLKRRDWNDPVGGSRGREKERGSSL